MHFLFSGQSYIFDQLMGFECIDVLGVWKFSRLMGFEPKATSIYFDINGNIWYNRGV